MVTNWATSFSHYKNRGFRWFFGSQLSVWFFLFPIIFQFSKNSLFQKRGAKNGFFNVQCFKLIFWKFSFLGLLKHSKNRGFSNFWGFLVVEREEIGKKMITGIYEFWFFWSKMAVSWRTTAFPKKRARNLYFIVFFGFRLFGPRCQKREILKSHQEKWKTLTDNWKAILWYFCCFFGASFFLVFFWCFFVCFVFFVFLVFFLVNFTLPGLRSHTLQTLVFSSLALSHLWIFLSSPGLARSSPIPRPVLARSSPGLARSSPGPAQPSSQAI